LGGEIAAGPQQKRVVKATSASQNKDGEKGRKITNKGVQKEVGSYGAEVAREGFNAELRSPRAKNFT